MTLPGTTALCLLCLAFAPALAAAAAPHEEQLQTCAHLARDHADDAVAIADAVLADKALAAGDEVRALACLGIAQAARGEPAKATASAERALRLIKSHPLLDGEAAYALGQVGGIFQTAGQAQRAATLYQRAYELTRRDGSPRAEMLALLNIAGLRAGTMDDPQAADPYFRQAIEIAARAGLESSYIYFNYGLNLSRLQRTDEALAALDEASSLAAKDGHQQGVRCRADSLRAEILIERGRLADAGRLLETTLAAQKALPDAQGEVASLRRRSLLELREGRLDAALASARESLAQTEKYGFPEEALQALAQIADVYAAQGRTAEAMDTTAQRYRRQIDALKRQNLDSLATLQADLQNVADERELERLAFDNQLKSLAIERARLLRNLAVAALAVLAALGSAFLTFQRRVTRRLRTLSMTDPLTGLTNRRIAARRLADLTHERDGRHVLILVDADRFKTINDSFGHVAGDRVLIELSRRLRACCGDGDLVARWGGEEFLVACRGSDHAQAQAFAEQLRAAVAAAPVVLADGTSLPLTVSIGFAPIPFFADSDERNWAHVVELADAALYAAKNAGRDAWAGVWDCGDDAAGPTDASPAQIERAAAAGRVELSGSAAHVWRDASRAPAETPPRQHAFAGPAHA